MDKTEVMLSIKIGSEKEGFSFNGLVDYKQAREIANECEFVPGRSQPGVKRGRGPNKKNKGDTAE